MVNRSAGKGREITCLLQCGFELFELFTSLDLEAGTINLTQVQKLGLMQAMLASAPVSLINLQSLARGLAFSFWQPHTVRLLYPNSPR